MAVPPPFPIAGDQTKPALRRALRAARAAHVASLSAAGARDGAQAAAGARDGAQVAAARHVVAHVPPGATIALYQAAGDEIDPAALAAMLAAAGRRLALPHIAGDRTTMRFLEWTAGDPLRPGAFGLRQPHDAAAPLAPDVILTPLLGFDRAGGRIGQGKGFYDRAFASLPGARRIGYAWSVQQIAQVPIDPWDVPLHAIATECAWITVEGAG